MKYMVMECHPAYAIVMDNAGRFQKVANLNYEVGQTINDIVAMNPVQKYLTSGRPLLFAAVSLAACLCFMVLGSWQLLFRPFGTVRMQINPDVQITVNRLGYAIALEWLNEDGCRLVDGYPLQWKKGEQVADDLADRAVAMGFLPDGGMIHLSVESQHAEWRETTESRVLQELKNHLGSSVTVIVGSAEGDEQAQTVIIPIPSTSDSTSSIAAEPIETDDEGGSTEEFDDADDCEEEDTQKSTAEDNGAEEDDDDNDEDDMDDVEDSDSVFD